MHQWDLNRTVANPPFFVIPAEAGAERTAGNPFLDLAPRTTAGR